MANLIEDVTRKKIFECQYWITKLFYANATTIIDLAVELQYFGGVCGAMGAPTDFLCLLLKMLLIKPDAEVLGMFLETDHKYLRLLTAMYLRLTGKPKDVYLTLEPLYTDFSKVAYKGRDATFSVLHIDECIETLLNEKQFCDILLPPMVKRYKLEEAGVLQPRVSILQEEVEELAKSMAEKKNARESDSDDNDNNASKKKKKKKKKEKKKALTLEQVNDVRAEAGLKPLDSL